MTKFFIILMFLSFNVFAGVGQVDSISKENDAHIFKGNVKTKINQFLEVEAGDEIVTGKTNIVINLKRGGKLAISRGSKLKVLTASDVKNAGTYEFALLAGRARLQIMSDAKRKVDSTVRVNRVEFLTANGDYEIFTQNKNVEVDVMSGEVEVRSPDIQTLVPQIVKSKTGFLYTESKKSYSDKKYSPKLISSLPSIKLK